jgi:BlaI family transcriptional regulator, penicillinase repressor
MAISLTDREADIMRILWERGASTVAEVRDALTDELAYTTVLTILRNLQAKGYVDHKPDGRAHRFFPRIQQQAARKNAVKHLMGKLFKGSADLLMTQLVSEHKLDEDQVERIRKILAEKQAKRK